MLRPYCAHTRGPKVQRGPSAVIHRGHTFYEDPGRSRPGANGPMRPQCTPADGLLVQPECAHTER